MSPDKLRVPDGTVIDLPDNYHEQVQNADVPGEKSLRRLGHLATSRLEASGFILGQE